ncbi:Uncharacterized conserved protein, DUF1800 family [Cognatiyoonia koreensis]|uniref:Uncharacterized conserved protein, DUF1800 family n=1 Tax=Cognatiyoonia koreensis TaxID=364200 RepID=A0A1I0QVW8_9RHOB|nr:DUF1800 domain-containing protein [Cognatiyoonia koreensis]SEW31837.1 Uncharacterized conserved protein, DUF1800 family [Cognatiyoonia koreensis]
MFHLSRRSFHKAALASLVAGLAKSAFASSPSDILLNRLTFGARPGEEIGDLASWLDQQFSIPANPPDLKARLADAWLHIAFDAGMQESGATYAAVDEMRPLSALFRDPAEMLDLLDYEKPFNYRERIRPADEVVAASLIRAVHSEAQLREVITQFWHDHFSVNAYKDEATAVYFPTYDSILRANALGNFRELLGAVATSPAMLTYLNNDGSRASPANENYARELLELHTLGAEHYHNDLYDDWAAVPGARDGLAKGYIDQDVYEVARAFTGWTVGDGRWVDEGVETPRTGRFAYVESWHDPYQKRILATEFPPNAGPMEDGRRVLDLLAYHPATARFVTRKFLLRLGIESPSDAYHARVASMFRSTAKAPDQIAQVIRAIVLDDEFATTPQTKLRRPFEVLAALYRRTGASVASPQMTFTAYLQDAGWSQHAVRPPTGHSDRSEYWANTRTLNGTISMLLAAHEDWFEAADVAALERIPDGLRTWGDLGTYWTTRVCALDSVDPWIELMGVASSDPLPRDDPGWIRWAAQSAIVIAAVNPEFMVR